MNENIENPIEETQKEVVEELKVTDMVIKANDCKLTIASLAKAKPAIPATPAIPGIMAADAVLDKEGTVITPAIKEVKAIPAIPEVPAVPACQRVFLFAKTKEIAVELIARMADQDLYLHEGSKVEPVDYGFKMTFSAENDKIIRAAFKKVKGRNDYNKPGLAKEAEAPKIAKEEKDKLKEIRKEEAKAAKKAKREAAKEEKKAKIEAEKKAKGASAKKKKKAVTKSKEADVATPFGDADDGNKIEKNKALEFEEAGGWPEV